MRDYFKGVLCLAWFGIALVACDGRDVGRDSRGIGTDGKFEDAEQPPKEPCGLCDPHDTNCVVTLCGDQLPGHDHDPNAPGLDAAYCMQCHADGVPSGESPSHPAQFRLIQ